MFYSREERSQTRLLFSIVCVFALSVLMSGCRSGESEGLRVVATTAHLESALKQIGGQYVQVSVLIPPGSCPGHYDIRPGDVRILSHSKALFTHGYEQFVPRLVKSAGKPGPRVIAVGVEGNWLVPDVRANALRKVCLLLCEIDPQHSGVFEETTNRLIDEEKKAAEALQNVCREAGLSGKPAICSDQLVPLVEWMGFDVVAVYGRAEEYTPSLLHKLEMLGKERKVELVIDNLQSGPDAGRQLAAEIGAKHVILSNFPGGYPDTDTWESCLRDNVTRVVKALDL